ncbi:hypothetical protein [Bordetella bronchiseptica]|uniref:hypothetical protein n=1 Tax=Bordetella bronchiseptica TaxID=518 RepID=UPI00123A325A|nr:hypothetical protein [Bordetella bronchiseptica]QET71343.1 hypothetical protein FOB42_13940 [Bordetella bronchiseptica]
MNQPGTLTIQPDGMHDDAAPIRLFRIRHDILNANDSQALFGRQIQEIQTAATMPQTGCRARSARAERATKNPVRCADAPSPGLLRLLAQDCYLDLLP